MTEGPLQTVLSDPLKEAVKGWMPKVLEKDLAAQLTRLGIGTGD